MNRIVILDIEKRKTNEKEDIKIIVLLKIQDILKLAVFLILFYYFYFKNIFALDW